MIIQGQLKQVVMLASRRLRDGESVQHSTRREYLKVNFKILPESFKIAMESFSWEKWEGNSKYAMPRSIEGLVFWCL